MTDSTYPTPDVPTDYPLTTLAGRPGGESPEKIMADITANSPALQGERTVPPSPILRWFDYEHLRPPLAAVSSWFHALAHDIERDLPAGAEKSTALRKLLEAKDAAVRAAIEGRDR